MDFALHRKEKVGKGLVRLLDRDLAASERALTGGGVGLDARVHKVRRRLKRDRSLLRVFEQVVPAEARAIRHQLRDAGRALAKLRERQALTAAASSLRRDLDPTGRAALRAALAPVREVADGQPLAEASALIAAAHRAIGRLPSKGGRKLLDRALRRAHRRVGDGYRKAVRTRSTADLHEWRKELKDLVHLIRLGGSRVAHGARTEARAGMAERTLGDDHDLALLAERVVQFARSHSGRLSGTAKIRVRRARLQNQAFRLGRKMEKKRPPRLDPR